MTDTMAANPDLERPVRPLTRFQTALIALGISAMGVGMTVNFVVVAPLARSAGLTELQVAGILTASSLVYALMTPIWGRWADRFGRKRVMVASLAFAGLTNAAFALALNTALAGLVTGTSAFFMLAGIRASFGLLSPGAFPAAMGAMIEATTPRNRAAGLGLIGTAMSVGSIIGPAGAAALAPFGALAPLWGSVCFSLFCSATLAFGLPTSRKNPPGSVRPVPLRIRDARIFPHLVFLFSYFMIVGAIQMTLAFLVADRYGLDRAEAVGATGTAFAALALAMIIVQFGYVQRRNPDPRRMLPRGLIIIMAGYVIAAIATPFWALCASFFLVGMGAALVVPAANALGSLSVEPHEQGAAAAVLAAAPPWAFVIGPIIGALLYGLNPIAPLIASALFLVGLWVYASQITLRD